MFVQKRVHDKNLRGEKIKLEIKIPQYVCPETIFLFFLVWPKVQMSLDAHFAIIEKNWPNTRHDSFLCKIAHLTGGVRPLYVLTYEL